MTLPVHGTAAGHDAGCTSVGGCPNQDGEHLTCVEAIMRRRSDFQASRLPRDQPLPRAISQLASLTDQQAEGPVHGTAWGYRRGCRQDRTCPHWALGRVTCAQARRSYLAGYRARRLQGEGKPFEHGTTRGALSGCTDEGRCPRGANGLTCKEARRRSRLETARRKGVKPRVEPVEAGGILEFVRSLRRDGWSLRRISREAGCGMETVRRLVIAAESGDGSVRILPETYASLEAMRTAETAQLLVG